MKLQELAAALPLEFAKELTAGGDLDTEITHVTHDSRQVRPGSLFVCIKGGHSDGHAFIAQALESGAVALAVSDSAAPPHSSPWLHLADTRAALPALAAVLYGRPSEKLGLTGVTGTNGKTTVTYMLDRIFRAAGKKTAVIGTTGVKIGGVDVETHWSVSTTPEATELQELLARMVDEGVDEVIMEVSSHAIDQERTAWCAFDTGVFTNLTQDHLDYHKTMQAYRDVKSRLFDEYARRYAKQDFHVSINVDDETGRDFAALSKAAGRDCWTYAVDAGDARLRATNLNVSPAGTSFTVTESGGESYPVSLRVGGLFNVRNALAAIGAARARGVRIDAVCAGLSSLPCVPGRFEPVDTKGKGYHVLVDYAHTPDGVENVLASARALKPTRLVCVFGCGGDRDRTKRPIMGRIAAELADRVIVTSDNPRSEQPDAIIKEILAGVDQAGGRAKTRIEPDRRRAIRIAVCEEAQEGDLIVIAGKGHETYQIIGSVVHDFDDRKVAREEIDSCG
ncbi:MAG: UDP-N-acetylmuramoyl-L-alanyl-D-glutamate--2,6-diaminopimelate ligase [Capsulimonadaceae bacterium]|nr:UDP-N-acetylmuramoyl-L-alanyl-D-glutamate--2,6-diaminopimelate ligase [Capsulimonadaceae bacterium]